MNDDVHPMLPAPRARLSSAERATLEAWFAAGAPPAPAGQQCSRSAPGSGGPSQSDSPPPDCQHFYELRAHGKASPDDASRCLDETSLLDSCNGLLDTPSFHLTD